MRIRQCYSALGSFRKDFMRKYGLHAYADKGQPAIFFGVYKPQWHRIIDHTGMLVIVWAGTDAMQLVKDKTMRDYLKTRSNIYHIAISRYIENDLKEIGLPYTSLPITPFVPDIEPMPIGNAVYAYLPPNFPELYGASIVERVQKKLPGLTFFTSHFGKLDRKELIEKIYPKCFLGLRLTKHDGLSNTVMELGLMGRKVVWNGGTPNTIRWDSEKELVKIIQSARKERLTWDVQKIGQEVRDYLLISDAWLTTEFYTTPIILQEDTAPPRPKTAIKTPTVSVIINTVGEDEQILRQAVMSYINQRDVFVQVIISTVEGDPSIKLAEELELDCCISEEKGIYQQLNKALGLVMAEWFCYASGNDVALNYKLITEVICCIQNQKKVCYSAFFVTDHNLNVTGIREYYPYDYLKHLTKGNFVNDCALVHTSLLKKYAPFDLQWDNSAYYDFWLRIYEGEGDVFCYNPTSTWYYRISKNSQHVKRHRSKAKKMKNAQIKANMLSQHIDYARKNKLI